MSSASEAYDIIIVGAGTAGCVLANRLSEDPNLSIAVLEAGSDRSKDERVYTPGLATDLLGNSDFDWQYVSQPEAGISGRCMKHPRGRLVGGTSAINSFALIYPSKAGIDVWADVGAEGWDWKTLEPYFKKFQTIREPSENVQRELNIIHGRETMKTLNGPIQASFPLHVNEFQRVWLETFRNLNLENQTDPLEGNALGGHTSTCHITGDTRERSHAGLAYLAPARARRNLHVLTGVMVEKIVFDHGNAGDAVATGVAYKDEKGGQHFIRARREVILAAGTFNTPQLLELSGIGNPNILNSLGIEVVHPNAAVGENLQDHIRTGISFEAVEGVERMGAIPPDESRKMYERDRTGPWAEKTAFSFAYMPLQQFLNRTEKDELAALLDKYLSDREASTPDQKRNDFLRTVIESPSEATGVAYLARKPATPGPAGNYISLFCMLSNPFSTGSVHITSTDASLKPTVHFNYYSHPLDIEIHARHAQSLEKLARTEPLSSYIQHDGKRLPEGCDVSTIAGAKQIIRDHAMTNYHPCGTCAIGTVVDPRLRVLGTRNVRVVDASVMPVIPRGNIITTVYAVAERAADIVREDLGVS